MLSRWIAGGLFANLGLGPYEMLGPSFVNSRFGRRCPMKRRITVLAAVLVVALVVVLLVGVFYQAPVDLMAIPPDLVASIPKSEQRNPLVYVEQVIRSNGTREEQARYLASGSNFENANRVWLKWDIIYRLAQDRVRKAKKA